MIDWQNMSIMFVLLTLGSAYAGFRCKIAATAFVFGVVQTVVLLILFPLLGYPVFL